MIQQGQPLPSATLSELTADGMQTHDIPALFADKKSGAVCGTRCIYPDVFGVPFTGFCRQCR